MGKLKFDPLRQGSWCRFWWY